MSFTFFTLTFCWSDPAMASSHIICWMALATCISMQCVESLKHSKSMPSIRYGHFTDCIRISTVQANYRIRYRTIMHRANPNYFEFLTAKLQRNVSFCCKFFYQNIILHTKNHSKEYKTMHYSIHKVFLRRFIN